MRQKSSLSLHRLKRKHLKTSQTIRLVTPKCISSTACHTGVCLQQITPVLTPIMSPFHSPVYKVSPPKKRAKKSLSARTLFEQQPSCEKYAVAFMTLLNQIFFLTLTMDQSKRKAIS
ncbi:hypothetical protein DPMN_012954 [Dreissena polymorpha]|uniref:Uncharacterized protein n=1 Tax=Dreissena polymorpha TaxID=45954 RepID=A0A9D4N7Z2_DREPO|nr:hypothetical protein DPMN_012954 [Dreissena polymorpha]